MRSPDPLITHVWQARPSIWEKGRVVSPPPTYLQVTIENTASLFGLFTGDKTNSESITLNHVMSGWGRGFPSIHSRLFWGETGSTTWLSFSSLEDSAEEENRFWQSVALSQWFHNGRKWERLLLSLRFLYPSYVLFHNFLPRVFVANFVLGWGRSDNFAELFSEALVFGLFFYLSIDIFLYHVVAFTTPVKAQDKIVVFNK